LSELEAKIIFLFRLLELNS